ncbi:MAG: thrombospondin type 3 repeat-containing protein [Candidatus Syntropharchaeia archaeon]
MKKIALLIFLLFIPIASASADSDGDGFLDGEESMPIGTSPTPPSIHVLSYEEFVESNIYAGEYVTLSARVDDVSYGRENGYSLHLMSLNATFSKNKAVATIGNSWHLDTNEMVLVDDMYNLSFYEGDFVVIVGIAHTISMGERVISINTTDKDGNGTIFLVLSPKEAYNRFILSMDHVKLRSSPWSTTSPIPVEEKSEEREEKEIPAYIILQEN